ncbi:MAG: MBL fold metallo-hydrolase [Candidatus Bipolaricaulota bacterium]|nr:MBL fold metallo-hydrolase [Candidatus Bipolaricaulota bacterium]MBS3792357.1 MBL fold metallo-hydrolase [Candidatus Bipolaricaulota bacterium]
MKLTIVYDNTAKVDLESDWGFSAVVEVGDFPKTLFDTGAKGRILTSNLKRLEIDPKSIHEVFISHDHADHTGGLSAFLEENNQVKVWVPPSFQGVKKAEEVVTVEGPTELHERIYSTGELEGIEQSLCVETEKGVVVIAGCSHPKMENILQTAAQFGEVHGIIGGLHANRPQSLEGLDLICPTHCTQHKADIKRLYPEQYVKGGVGRIIEI